MRSSWPAPIMRATTKQPNDANSIAIGTLNRLQPDIRSPFRFNDPEPHFTSIVPKGGAIRVIHPSFGIRTRPALQDPRLLFSRGRSPTQAPPLTNGCHPMRIRTEIGPCAALHLDGVEGPQSRRRRKSLLPPVRPVARSSPDNTNRSLPIITRHGLHVIYRTKPTGSLGQCPQRSTSTDRTPYTSRALGEQGERPIGFHEGFHHLDRSPGRRASPSLRSAGAGDLGERLPSSPESTDGGEVTGLSTIEQRNDLAAGEVGRVQGRPGEGVYSPALGWVRCQWQPPVAGWMDCLIQSVIRLSA